MVSRVPIPLTEVANLARVNTVLLDVATELRDIAERKANAEVKVELAKQIERMIGQIEAIDRAVGSAAPFV